MLSNKRLVAVCVIVFCCNLSLMVLFIKYNVGEKCYVTVSEHQDVVNIIPDDFLSVGIDTSEIEHSNSIDFSNARLRELTAALAPARIRLGGTMSDRLIFSKDDIVPITCEDCHSHKHSKHICSAVRKMCRHKPLPFFVMTGTKWIEINKFCESTNTKLLFSFNLLLRNESGWSEQNAKDLIIFSKSKNFSVDWQLGNEPNSFPHTFNISISPKQLAKDFKKLRNLLNENGYKESLLIGPDTTRPQPHRPECLRYMIEFLGNASQYINVRSWHQYYLNSRTVKLIDFWKPSTYDLLKEQIKIMKNNTHDYNSIPMWLTETSSSYDGGAPGLSNSYAATPLWIDKLGLSAKYNISTVVRQSLIGGNYSLLSKELNPLPDWWVSVLYKKVVGNKVLHLKCRCSHNQRVYAHCTNRYYTNDTSAVTIYAVNLELKIIKFLLNGTALHGDNLNIDEYIISAPSNNRLTKTIFLNGRPLSYESTPPVFQPRLIKYGKHISLPPYSIGFWVVRNTSIKICKESQ